MDTNVPPKHANFRKHGYFITGDGQAGGACGGMFDVRVRCAAESTVYKIDESHCHKVRRAFEMAVCVRRACRKRLSECVAATIRHNYPLT